MPEALPLDRCATPCTGAEQCVICYLIDNPPLTVLDFDDGFMEEVISRRQTLSRQQREFLVDDTPTLPRCTSTRDQLASMDDAELMATVRDVWFEYSLSVA